MNKSFKRISEHFGNLQDLRYDFRNLNLIRLVLSQLNKGSLFDVGCGAGHLLYHAKKKGFSISGVEPNSDLIRLSKKLYGDLNIRKGYAEKIKIKSKYDNLVLLDVLEHIKDDSDSVRQLRGFLNDSGRLVIVVPAHPLLYGKRDELAGHYRRYSKKQIISAVSMSGFKVVNVRYWNAIGFLPYLISERVFHKSLYTDLRTGNKKSTLKKCVSGLLNIWFRYVENNVNFGFGLSLICVAKRLNKDVK
ncbi:MAG: class I SAM-dependent methyltransferase [Bacteroidota bacterium]